MELSLCGRPALQSWLGGGGGGALVGGFFFYNFAAKGVPELDQYCQGRYGTAWTEFKEEVPYRLFPGLY